jgi:hypothetical protein
VTKYERSIRTSGKTPPKISPRDREYSPVHNKNWGANGECSPEISLRSKQPTSIFRKWKQEGVFEELMYQLRDSVQKSYNRKLPSLGIIIKALEAYEHLPLLTVRNAKLTEVRKSKE